MRDLYADIPAADLAALLDRPVRSIYQTATKLGLRKSEAFLFSDMSARIQRGQQHPAMVASRFPAGHRPWNVGKTGWKAGGRSAETRFAPGHVPHTWVPIGTYRISQDGQLERKFSDRPGAPHLRWRPVARLVWEAAHGPVPAGHLVVFRPGQQTVDPEQITIDRLECITRGENARRNHPRTKSPELGKLVQLKGAITRQVRRIEREARAPTAAND